MWRRLSIKTVIALVAVALTGWVLARSFGVSGHDLKVIAYSCLRSNAVALAQPAPSTSPSVNLAHPKLLIVSFDGLRPDLALRADMPTFRSVLARGSYSFWARTTELSVTLPSHTSMLTGVTPARHGITFNDTQEGDYVKTPTLFAVAKQAGYSTACVAGKRKFVTLAVPGTCDFEWIQDEKSDRVVAQHAAEFIDLHAPDVLFVHLGAIDYTGHGPGWGTPEQIAAIEDADRALATLIDALKRRGVFDQTTMILSADHGGAGRTHGPDDARSRHIPWVIAGPGIRHNLDLTIFPDLVINTEDTFATACWALGITPPANIDGKIIPVGESEGELIKVIPSTGQVRRGGSGVGETGVAIKEDHAVVEKAHAGDPRPEGLSVRP